MNSKIPVGTGVLTLGNLAKIFGQVRVFHSASDRDKEVMVHPAIMIRTKGINPTLELLHLLTRNERLTSKLYPFAYML